MKYIDSRYNLSRTSAPCPSSLEVDFMSNNANYYGQNYCQRLSPATSSHCWACWQQSSQAASGT
eukprot:scaffold16571_cov76-Attheya_sp.AAC.7